MTTPKVFINYRRKDSEQYVFSLGLLLESRFPKCIFWDRDTLKVGERYKEKIEGALRESGVVIVVIGKAWLDIRDEQGRRRLDDPEDVLRTELLTAIKLKVPLIPVLVGSARMPSAKDLPEELWPLVDWQATQLNLDDPKGSMARLIADVQRLLDARRADEERKEQPRLEERRRAEEEHRRQEQLAAERVAEEKRQRQAAEQARVEREQGQAAEQARLEQQRRIPEKQPDEKPLSQVQRLVDIFIAPSKTFTDIKRSASWWMPWVLMSIFGLALVFTVDNKVGMDKVAENSIQQSPKRAAKVDALPPEQRTSQMETAAKFTRMIAYSSPIVTVIIVGIIAAVLLGTFNFGLGAELKFMQCMAISMYAFLPGIIKALLAIVTLVIGGGEGFTFEQQLASNPGPLVDPGSTFLHSIASSLDLFNIWTLVLTGIGYSCVTRVKRGTCMAVVFGWWAVVTLGGAAIAAAFS